MMCQFCKKELEASPCERCFHHFKNTCPMDHEGCESGLCDQCSKDAALGRKVRNLAEAEHPSCILCGIPTSDPLAVCAMCRDNAALGGIIRKRHPTLILGLADYAHESWRGWMEWMFEKAFEIHNETGEPFIARWKRQMQTPFQRLSDAEQASDVQEAKTIVARVLSCCDRIRAAGLMEEDKSEP